MTSIAPTKLARSFLGQAFTLDDPFAASPFRRAPYWLVAGFIALIHLGFLGVGNLVLARGPQALPAFPGFGLDLVLILVFGPRYWPVLLAAYFANSAARHVGWFPSCGVAVAGLLRTLLGAAMVRWVSSRQKALGPFEDLAGISLAGVVATAVGAAIGASVLAAVGGVPAVPWTAAFRRWWIADALGLFTSGPPLLAIARSWMPGKAKFSSWLALQLLLYFSAVAGACYLVFFRPDTRYLLFSVFLLILIAAAWFGAAAARFAAVIIAFAAIWATRQGIGAFGGTSLRENLQNLAFFLIAVSLTGMTVGAFRAIGNLALPAGVLLAGWACSGWLYATVDRNRGGYDQARFESAITSVEARIQSGYRSYEDLAWSAAGLVTATGPSHPEVWQRYVAGLHLENHDPVIGGLSVGYPADVLGLDPPQRIGAERARDTGSATLSGRSQTTNGLRLFVPVYRPGASLAALADRRRAWQAWVMVAFSEDALFRSAWLGLQDHIDLRASDGDEPRDQPAGGTTDSLRRVTHLTLGGHSWTLVWTPEPDFPFQSRTPYALAAGCTALLSLLLAALVLMLQTTRQRASDRWRLLQSASSLGTWELDLRSETVHCSEQLLRLYGLPESRDRLPLREWLAAVHPEDREGLASELHGIGTHPVDRQYRVVWPDGSMHWLHSKALPAPDDNGSSNRIVGVDFDISEIKQLQSQLAQAQKLQSVGQLASGIAHEINTPIQYIGDNGKFLEDAFRDLIQLTAAGRKDAHPPGIEEELNARELEYLRKEVPKATSQLLEGVEQVARIVRAMKEFSHPGPIEKATADINRAIQNTIVVSKNEWKYVAELTTELEPDLPPVPCRVGEFNQVILNLIVNAAHAIADVVQDSGRKGRIHISTRQHDAMLEVRVSDTGTGIPESIRSKIFDPFFTTKPVGKGTGQGLAIAHALIVQKHGGSITFESEAGRGTTFLIQLPLERELQTA